MLHLIPAPLHRAGLPLAHWLRKLWWGLRKPELIGCCVIAMDTADRIMLVRHSYGNRAWTFPGGGLDRTEDPEQGARREFREETGCTLRDVELFGVWREELHGARHVQHLFTGQAEGAPRPDGREVVELCFFARDALPCDLTMGARYRLLLLDEFLMSEQ